MRTSRATRSLGFVLGAVLLGAAPASAINDVHHDGPPAVWGPQIAPLCANPNAAAAAGYTVVVLNNANNTYTGGPMAEAIYALGGNDQINGAGGDDLVCLGTGTDTGVGGVGNDGVFGEGGNDTLFGSAGNDYLDGGIGADVCNGNAGVNALVSC